MRKFATALSVPSTNTAYPATPQFIIGSAVRTKPDYFTRFGLVLMWRTGVRIIYSFDGVNDHGDVEDTTLNKGLSFDDIAIPYGAIWFRVASASTSTLRVEAFAQNP
jgi:hypothetical protein